MSKIGPFGDPQAWEDQGHADACAEPSEEPTPAKPEAPRPETMRRFIAILREIGASPANIKIAEEAAKRITEEAKPEVRADWPEDLPHENGDYRNRCIHCGQMFQGHKRRVVCKVCASARPEAPKQDRARETRVGDTANLIRDLEAALATEKRATHDLAGKVLDGDARFKAAHAALAAEKERAEKAEETRDFFANRLNEALGALGYEVPGDTPDGRYRCGLCGPKDDRLIEADHEWAPWHEKWKAAIDLMSSCSARAEAAESEVTRLKEDYQLVIAAVLRCNPIPASEHADDRLEPPWEVIDRMRAEVTRLREVLGRIEVMADHAIPFYAYGDNQAACAMSNQLDAIARLCREAKGGSDAK